MDSYSAYKPQGGDSAGFGDAKFTFNEIYGVVNAFYGQVAVDEVLSEPFSSVEDWPEHIERLTHFWWVRLGGVPYLPLQYNPVEKHYLAGFNQRFLDRWLEMFHNVLTERLDSGPAKVWKTLSEQMGKGLMAGNEMYRRRFG